MLSYQCPTAQSRGCSWSGFSRFCSAGNADILGKKPPAGQRQMKMMPARETSCKGSYECKNGLSGTTCAKVHTQSISLCLHCAKTNGGRPGAPAHQLASQCKGRGEHEERPQAGPTQDESLTENRLFADSSQQAAAGPAPAEGVLLRDVQMFSALTQFNSQPPVSAFCQVLNHSPYL